jgi:hypothetical protein
MNYLKPEQYYIDLYDLHTIEQCLDWEKNFSQVVLPPLDSKKLNKRQSTPIKVSLMNVSLYFIKGYRYKAKASTIREWLDKDRKKQSFFDSTPIPQNIRCTECGLMMKNTMKELDDYSGKVMRVLFFFECPSCKKRKGVYNTGEVYVSKPDPCEKCSSNTQRTYKRKGNIVTTIWKCMYCNYTKKESEDYGKSDDSWEKEQMENKKLLQKYRSTYCLSEKEGLEYIQAAHNLNVLTKSIEEQKLKEKDPTYQKAKKLKKLKIGQLKELLEKTVEKGGFQDLAFAKPEMGQYIIIEFSVNDMQEERNEYESSSKLKKLIKAALVDTTWRLMSEGVSYRLGILTGMLKAYEKEEDILKLVS